MELSPEMECQLLYKLPNDLKFKVLGIEKRLENSQN